MSVIPPVTAPDTPVYLSSSPPSSSQLYGYSEPGGYISVPRTMLGFTNAPVVSSGVSSSGIVTVSHADSVKSSGLLSVNLATLLGSEHPQYLPANSARTVEHFELTPAVALNFPDPDHFIVQCFVYAVLIKAGRETWHSRYVVVTAKPFSPVSPSLLEDTRPVVSDCLNRAIALFTLHQQNPPGLFRDADLAGYSTIPRSVVVPLLPERIAYFDGLGLWELDRSLVSSVTMR